MVSIVEPKPSICGRCDFGSGQRGMDHCSTCDGTGSIFRVGLQVFPNTEEGYLEAVYALNDPEGEREKVYNGIDWRRQSAASYYD
jgi:hypothetical protein